MLGIWMMVLLLEILWLWGRFLELIMEDGPSCGLHFNVDKTKVFLARGRPEKQLAGVFPPNTAGPLHGVKLLGEPASVDFDFSSDLVMKRVNRTIVLIDTVARVFEMAQHSFDAALRFALERIVTASGPGFGDWQWRLSTLPFGFGRLGVYSAGDVLNKAFPASRLQSASLQTKLLRHSSIVTSRPTFDDALYVFNTKMETDLLSNPSEIVVPKIMKKLADIYFTRVTQNAESTYSLSSRQMALSRISVGKEVDIGLGGGHDKPLRPMDMLLYSWDRRLDLCVDLKGSSLLTQTGMVDFVNLTRYSRLLARISGSWP
ncbi:hypothetical protein Tco_1015718 [Tanacetum coccineum]|uniref:Uncharacterized protein n=1 Tax=Tanacetum coccineum TaxID=301880 RepID=A0ABQ5FMP9_9ASTR